MPTAKSYQDMEHVGQPFEDNGRMYIKVKGKCSRCGGSGHCSYNQMDGTMCYGCRGTGKQVMTVRWYTEREYEAQQRAAERRAEQKAIKQEARRIKFAARNAFGFGEAGYITLYKGDMEVLSEYFKSFTIDEEGHRAAWYNLIFGWYTPSKLSVPTNLPKGIEAVQLDWDVVRDPEDEENLQMRDNEWVIDYVQKLLAVPSKSEYQGEVGSWIECNVTVVKKVTLNGRYGDSYMHIMQDANENVYVWTTSSKSLDIDAQYNIKMKVKEHKEYKGTKQTIVWYCKIKED